MIIRKSKYILSSNILKPDHGFSLKGATKGNDWNERKKFLNSMLNKNSVKYVSIRQIHSTKVLEYTGNEIGEGDGIVYKKKKGLDPVCLVITTADCVPVLFADINNRIIAAAHSGWRGTAGNIVHEVVQKMVLIGGTLENIKVIIGPGVSSCCYEISGDRLFHFSEECIEQRGEKKYLNLTKTIFNQLCASGIEKNNIDYGVFCTQCETDLFDSYRREGPNRIQMVNFICV